MGKQCLGIPHFWKHRQYPSGWLAISCYINILLHQYAHRWAIPTPNISRLQPCQVDVRALCDISRSSKTQAVWRTLTSWSSALNTSNKYIYIYIDDDRWKPQPWSWGLILDLEVRPTLAVTSRCGGWRHHRLQRGWLEVRVPSMRSSSCPGLSSLPRMEKYWGPKPWQQIAVAESWGALQKLALQILIKWVGYVSWPWLVNTCLSCMSQCPKLGNGKNPQLRRSSIARGTILIEWLLPFLVHRGAPRVARTHCLPVGLMDINGFNFFLKYSPITRSYSLVPDFWCPKKKGVPVSQILGWCSQVDAHLAGRRGCPQFTKGGTGRPPEGWNCLGPQEKSRRLSWVHVHLCWFWRKDYVDKCRQKK